MADSERSTERSAERAGERRAVARSAVVWETLEPSLGGGPIDVLDIGGGTGVSAVRFAERGHRVVVVDPSPDALASLARRAQEVGVEVNALQGELSTLRTLLEPESVDLALCHGVLEVVDEPVAALRTIGEVLRPDGTLSLLIGQRTAAVLARAMAGHPDQAVELLDSAEPIGRTGRRFSLQEARAALAEAGFEVVTEHGVRVFTDLVPARLLDEAGAAQAMAELERRVAGRPDYLPLATQLHLTARKA